MKKIGNWGAMMSACCLFAALISAQHDYRKHVVRTDQTSLTESAAASPGSFVIEQRTTSSME